MTGMDTWVALVISAVIIGLSAFFVAIEFALVAARRHRLAEAAETSLSARAALKSARDVSMLLAGSQLGITLCTLAIGAITKPAVHHMLTPVLEDTGLPAATSTVVAFVLSLLIVTFLHLVVGEMAPKSWAIAHPEKSAQLLAIPMRMFMWLTRPLLVALNGMANWCLHRIGVQPVDELTSGRNPDDLRHLLEHSTKAGTLDAQRHQQLTTALDLHSRPVRDITQPRQELASVSPADTVERIQAASRDSGHLRLVVLDGEQPVGVVHVRDSLTQAPEVTAAALLQPALNLPASTPLHTALQTMRRRRNHLALVYSDTDNELLGLITLQDVLNQLLPMQPAGTRLSAQTPGGA
ncbi:CBS domain containing-hemolysin-like protein [Tamaricihabitans halophyticus]|uniref:CBS domain containing-hemolysin-like protein n=1 Tax=Tamaricihabitans halophyticus TaxID=1262583 RepID=A0A4R2QVZ2_9PSEU|nr:hemolysin family protein [Tamaricihabitans halophyticus]TCP54243.1 CBS domain containing-hemolysin-like protein [Tamaricihabitans halophyticus]